MAQRTFNLVTGAIFLIIAVLHLARLIFGWGALIGGWVVPPFVSGLALPVAGFLAYQAFRLQKPAP